MLGSKTLHLRINKKEFETMLLETLYLRNKGHKIEFYHLEVPNVESTQWLNLTNCGVVTVKTGQISLAELEVELSEIYSKDWPGR